MFLPPPRRRKHGTRSSGCSPPRLALAWFRSKIKNLAAEMAAAEAALKDDEVISYLLAGLPSDYDPFLTAMTTKNES
jgi:hypothetical protein